MSTSPESFPKLDLSPAMVHLLSRQWEAYQREQHILQELIQQLAERDAPPGTVPTYDPATHSIYFVPVDQSEEAEIDQASSPQNLEAG